MSFFTQHFAQRAANNEADDDVGAYDEWACSGAFSWLTLREKLEQEMRLNAALESVSAVSVTVFICGH